MKNSRVNVTELLTDPDFVGGIKQITRTTRLNSFGENILTECSKDTVGSVQPITFKDIQRIPESLRVADMMTFFFKGSITATAPGKYTDILIFGSKRFQVLTVNDWSTWGEGWVEGACVAQVVAP